MRSRSHLPFFFTALYIFIYHGIGTDLGAIPYGHAGAYGCHSLFAIRRHRADNGVLTDFHIFRHDAVFDHHAGSYIDDFYQTYWTDYLDDCLACGDTYNFFLRHYDDFVTAYASTNPSEDICEAFAYFVLRPRDPMADTAVWSQKLDFFYAYPELTAFRDQVRSGLGLAEDQAYEDLFPAADSSTDPAAEAA